MNPSFEQTLVEVWRQALVENATVVELSGRRYPVRITPRKGLRHVDFIFDSNEIRGLEQNPDTKSRWAVLARTGKKVMQFINDGRYVANVADGKVTIYGRTDGWCPTVHICPFGRNSTNTNQEMTLWRLLWPNAQAE